MDRSLQLGSQSLSDDNSAIQNMGVNPRGPGGPGPPPNILAEGAQQLVGPPNI